MADGQQNAQGGGWLDWFWTLLGYDMSQKATPGGAQAASSPTESAPAAASSPPGASAKLPGSKSAPAAIAPPSLGAGAGAAKEQVSAEDEPEDIPESPSGGDDEKEEERASSPPAPATGDAEKLSEVDVKREGRPLTHSGKTRPVAMTRRPSRAHLKQRKEMPSETRDEPKEVEERGGATSADSSAFTAAPAPTSKRPPMGVGMMPMFDPSAALGKLKKTQPR